MSKKEKKLVKAYKKRGLEESAKKKGHYVICTQLNAKGLKKLRAAEKQIATARPVEYMDEEEEKYLMKVYGVTEDEYII